MALGSLVVQMSVDLARWRSDMGQAAQVSNTRLREIERSTAATMRQLSSVGRAVQNAFAIAGISVGVGAVVAGFKRMAIEAIEFGDEMVKASQRTGLAASEFAELAQAAKLADVQVDTLSKAFRSMQVAISQGGSGNKGPLETFRALGVSVETLKALKPDAQLDLLADRLAALQDPADRARAGSELFGRAWQDIAPFLAEGADGIRRARQEVEKLGGALTEEQIRKLADADQAIKQLNQSWSAFARTLTASVAPALIDILNRLAGIESDDRLQKRILERQNTVSYYDKTFPGKFDKERAAAARELAEALALVNQRRETERRSLLGEGRQATRRRIAPAPGFLDDGEATQAKKRQDSAKREAEELQRLQGLYAGVATSGLAAMQSLESPTEAITRKFEEQRAALTALAQTYPGLAAQAEQSLARAAVIADDELEALKRNNGELERHRELMAAGRSVYDETRTATERWAAEIERVTELFKSGALGEGQAAVETFGRAVAQANKELEDGAKELTQLSVFADEAARAMQSAFADFLFAPFEQGLKGMLSGFLDTIRRMVAELAAQELLKQFFDWAGTAIGGPIGNFVGSLGKRATGGPVMAGEAYTVGERGPEKLVMGSRSGYVIPNGAGGAGGGVVINQSFDLRGADADRIMAILPPLLERNKRETMAAMIDLQRRGRFA